MILDVYKNAFDQDIQKISWLPIIIKILLVIFIIILIIIEINHYLALFRIKNELIKVRELLENNNDKE